MLLMPRGVKGSGTPRKSRKPTDERIADLDKKIEQKKREIADLNDQRNGLLESRELEKTNELLKLISDTGLSTDELLELARNAKKDS
jgi:hypothetical protein